jgi:hypothetical protein
MADPDTDSVTVPRRTCPECIRRANPPRRQLASVITTPTAASSRRTVAELKAKYGRTLQTDSVIEDNYGNGNVDATKTPQSVAPWSRGRSPGLKRKGKASEAVELLQRPATPSKNRARSSRVWNPGMARRAAEETLCQCNAAFLNSVVGHVTDVEQVNESSGNTEEADALLETFLRPAAPCPAPQHPHRYPFR